MTIFNSYVELLEGNYGLITIKSPFSYGFPMVFNSFLYVYQAGYLGYKPIERAMAEIITPATQLLSHSPRVAGPATLAEWLSGWSSHSGRVAEWLSGWSSHSGRVAEWLSGWSSHSGRVAEWLSGWSSHSGRVAEWLSGWSSEFGRVAEWLYGFFFLGYIRNLSPVKNSLHTLHLNLYSLLLARFRDNVSYLYVVLGPYKIKEDTRN